MATDIHWMPGKDGALLGYIEMNPDNPDEPAERENPPLVIKPMTYPPGFTLYRNDFKLGKFLFLKDTGRHDTLDQAKESAAAMIATPKETVSRA